MLRLWRVATVTVMGSYCGGWLLKLVAVVCNTVVVVY